MSLASVNGNPRFQKVVEMNAPYLKAWRVSVLSYEESNILDNEEMSEFHVPK
jgi:hypothetical protein